MVVFWILLNLTRSSTTGLYTIEQDIFTDLLVRYILPNILFITLGTSSINKYLAYSSVPV